MYKYIFCDLDGTLLDDDKKISGINLEAIEKARAEGTAFVVCTGRLPFCVVDYIKPLISEDYVCANGSLVHFNGRDIVNKHLDYKDSVRLLEYAKERNLCLRIYMSDYLYIVNDAHMGFSYKNQRVASIDEVMEIIGDKDIVKLGIMLQPGQDFVKNEIEGLGISAETAYSFEGYLEVNPLLCNKGNGIRAFCHEAGIELKDVICIGDNDNDLSMLGLECLSVCPSNGSSSARKMADIICPVDNNHNAVAWAIKHYVFGEEC